MDTNSPTSASIRPLKLGLVGAALTLATACGPSNDSVEAEADRQDVPTTVTNPAPSTSTTIAVPATTEGCGSQCPLTDEQRRAVDAFFEAYNGDDWDAVLATISDPDPSWRMSPMLVQDVEDMRTDFLWSAAMDETWVPTECVDQYGIVLCQVEMEDALVRAFASLGLGPSVCSLSFKVDGDGVRPERYDLLSGCHSLYDGVMHAYGGWFEANYPDEAPIQGFHYRGWNPSDETAGTRAVAHVEEFHAAAVELLGADGDIATYRPAN